MGLRPVTNGRDGVRVPLNGLFADAPVLFFGPGLAKSDWYPFPRRLTPVVAMMSRSYTFSILRAVWVSVGGVVRVIDGRGEQG